MTIKEAALKALEDLGHGGTAKEVYLHILRKQYYNFAKGKTPENTVSALLGDFITKKDSRVKRLKNEDNIYCYYLSANESLIGNTPTISASMRNNSKTYKERDLHKLLVTYLKSKGIYAKTIFHEQSNKNEEHQKWAHPDIIGAKFIEYKNSACQSFFKATSHLNSVDIYSYELKKEINNDYDLKKCFFQAVSNSSWANYGYLVAFEIGDNLLEELERLNYSFGIGFILLKANPYETQILYPAKRKDLDFRTIDKLCNVNKDFNKFIEQVELFITAEEKVLNSIKISMEKFCDSYFQNDEESKVYCMEKRIPITEEDE